MFISHSSSDGRWAEQIAAGFEAEGVPCWYAPRDIRPGLSYAQEIGDAIDGCRSALVVWSANSARSQHVLSEVDMCVAHGKRVQWARIDDTPLAGTAFEFYLSKLQHIDLRLAGPDTAIRPAAPTPEAEPLRNPLDEHDRIWPRRRQSNTR